MLSKAASSTTFWVFWYDLTWDWTPVSWTIGEKIHNFASWQCLATFCPDDTAEVHWLWDMRLCHIHHILLISHPPTTIFQASGNVLMPRKTFLYKEVETAFKDFFVSNPLQFYHTGINDPVNGRNVLMLYMYKQDLALNNL